MTKARYVVNACGPRMEIDALLATLNQRTRQPSQLYEWLRIHSVMVQLANFSDTSSLSKSENLEYLAIFVADEAALQELHKELARSSDHKKVVFGHIRPLIFHQLSAETSAFNTSHLVDSSMTIGLKFVPRPNRSGWLIEYGAEISVSLLAGLHGALVSCLALGEDGRSPLVDVHVKVESADFSTSDAFLFRQTAAIYKGVRACFSKALSQANLRTLANSEAEAS